MTDFEQDMEDDYQDGYEKSLDECKKRSIQSKATPRPWYFKEIVTRPYVVTDGGYVLAKCWNPEINKGENDKANAELIVRAVNNFDSLLEACRKAQEALGEIKLPSRKQVDTLINLSQAITKATEENL